MPRAIRSPFARAGLTGATVWAVAALFLSVVPSYAERPARQRQPALFGAIAAIMLGTSCVAQFAARGRRTPRATQAAGLIVLAAGLAALVTAFPTQSLVLVLASALLAGAGHGLGFAGAQEEINEIAPPAQRGEVTSAFYTCIYGGVAVSIIGLGLLPLSLVGRRRRVRLGDRRDRAADQRLAPARLGRQRADDRGGRDRPRELVGLARPEVDQVGVAGAAPVRRAAAP